MAIKITLESFLAVLRRSNLIEAEQIKRLADEFRGLHGEPPDAKPFADVLIQQKLITPWQAEKLLLGKHKGFFLGRYKLKGLLGKGGMSSVYLAEHVLMRRMCAIKVLPARRVNDASYLGRFHREAQAVAALDHPNIVRAYDVDHEKDGEFEIHGVPAGTQNLVVWQEKVGWINPDKAKGTPVTVTAGEAVDAGAFKIEPSQIKTP